MIYKQVKTVISIFGMKKLYLPADLMLQLEFRNHLMLATIDRLLSIEINPSFFFLPWTLKT